MMRKTRIARFGQAPSVYPFPKPFYDTPHDQDRHRLNVGTVVQRPKAYPRWMDKGADGTGRGVGLHRTHPLSSLKGNLRRTKESVPYVFQLMMQGAHHKSGIKLYYRGGKVPNPSQHPHLTGEPCAVYGWKVLDYNVTRQFPVPFATSEKVRYRPYVALHERKILSGENELSAQVKSSGGSGDGALAKKRRKADGDDDSKKPMMKRLFFWR